MCANSSERSHLLILVVHLKNMVLLALKPCEFKHLLRI